MLENYSGSISTEFFSKIQECFALYKNHKRQYDTHIIENNKWYKSRYADSQNSDYPPPTTPYLFNVIANKHADIMDNYPEPNILERREERREEMREEMREVAERLTKILPVQLDLCDFKTTYSRAWWYKLKNGAACYGVFYNSDAHGGKGDIDIKKIDLLNMSWEPGISELQDSRFLFVTALIDNDELKVRYPDKSDCFHGNAASDALTYGDMQNTTSADILKDKTVVIDCYYKKVHEDGRQTVELIKYAGNTILDASEDNSDEGLYAHGMYPFVMDVMYPDEDSPVGFGIIDIVKNPQLYIDKLDSLISKNALISGKTRYMIKDSGGICEDELLDTAQDIIHVAGSIGDDNIRELQARPLHNFIIQHRQNKINELKEVAGNRDFQQGDTRAGVTAASAITALQQAGEKLSRDMIQESYTAYKNIIHLCIELMRQFYNKPRSYRVENENGGREYVSFSNRELMQSTHPIELDVSVNGEKNNPVSREVQNETLLNLWEKGVFNPNMTKQAIALLESMQLDGKEKLLECLKQLAEEQKQNEDTELESEELQKDSSVNN